MSQRGADLSTAPGRLGHLLLGHTLPGAAQPADPEAQTACKVSEAAPMPVAKRIREIDENAWLQPPAAALGSSKAALSRFGRESLLFEAD